MSTFAKSLRTNITAIQRPKASPLRITVESTFSHSLTRPLIDKQIHFDVNWHQTVWITDDNNFSDRLQESSKLVAEQLLEDVYGDFKEVLYQLRLAALEGNHDRVVYLTNQLIKETKGQE